MAWVGRVDGCVWGDLGGGVEESGRARKGEGSSGRRRCRAVGGTLGLCDRRCEPWILAPTHQKLAKTRYRQGICLPLVRENTALVRPLQQQAAHSPAPDTHTVRVSGYRDTFLLLDTRVHLSFVIVLTSGAVA